VILQKFRSICFANDQQWPSKAIFDMARSALSRAAREARKRLVLESRASSLVKGLEKFSASFACPSVALLNIRAYPIYPWFKKGLRDQI
jgi:hypothetical protein